MKRILFASLLALGASQAHASYLSAIIGAAGSNLTLEDNSREQWVDNDNSGTITPGDQLIGFLKFDSFNPPATATDNLYAVFSQTFGTDFTVNSNVAGNRYSGSFSDANLQFIDYTGTNDWVTDDLLGSVSTAITDIFANGTVAFEAGISSPGDYFAFNTSRLSAGQDFVLNPGVTSNISSSIGLGNFSAGLSITTNNLPVVFNAVIETSFENLNTGTLYGSLNGDGPYQLAVVNGNFGGICENPTNGCTQTVQNIGSGFVDNADVVINAAFIPEPESLVLVGFGLGLIGLRKKFARG